MSIVRAERVTGGLMVPHVARSRGGSRGPDVEAAAPGASLPQLTLEAGLLEPRIEARRQRLPERDRGGQQRVDLRRVQLEAAQLLELDGLARVGGESPAQLFVRHQPPDQDLDAALSHP